MSIDIRKEEMEHVEIFGKPALLSDSRIARDEVPQGWYCYDLRGMDSDPGRPATLEDQVAVNFAGAVLSRVPLKRPATERKRMNGTLNYLGEQLTLAAFYERYDLKYPQETRKYLLRPASPDEAGLFYSATEPENDKELACVGHLRMDFGHRGQEFWHSWWPHNNDELNIPAFKAELDQVMAEFRERGPLKDLKTMSEYCGAHPQGRLESWDGAFGFVAESEGYRYCLRCIPRQGDNNGYLYIYDKRQQELNMAQEQQSGLTEAGRQALRDAADPAKPHTYAWFVIERYGQEGERLHKAESLTGVIDCYNGLTCDSRRLGVTKDGIATIDLVVMESGASHLDEGWQTNPRFTADSEIFEAAARLRLSIAGLDQPQQNMTFGGM